MANTKNRPVLNDMICPACHSQNSVIRGHILLSETRTCVDCGFVYNHDYINAKKFMEFRRVKA